MDRTTITCTSNGANAPADILDKSDMRMKVIMVAMTDMPITMFKRTPHDAFYVGNAAGLEFTSIGDVND